MPGFSEGNGRLVVYARSQGHCEVCTRPASEWHHRVNRSQGGTWSPANGLHLCRWCHQWVTERRTHALSLGLALPNAADPTIWPAYLSPTMWWRGWWFLDPEGCWRYDADRSTHDSPPADVSDAIARLTLDRRLGLVA